VIPARIKKVRSPLQRRTEQEWLDRLSEIGCYDLRCKVASIVWWDWLASDPANSHSVILSRYVNIPMGREPDPEAVFDALVTLGYHPESARRRAIPLSDQRREAHRLATKKWRTKWLG
jgi:hypothetical protein